MPRPHDRRNEGFNVTMLNDHTISTTAHVGGQWPSGGAHWPSGLARRTGDRVVLGLNPAAATSLRNFGNSVYLALPVSFGGDTKSRRSLLSGVYARVVKHPTQGVNV